ncbi:cache domain-containing protein [Amorphus sp. 3PC139-8]|uniref:PDC sensor domain-containing protein n=1 Tax=Amorphus sp. 3PC139-8 TaxID=2735676 RepID=UPI00345D4D7D
MKRPRGHKKQSRLRRKIPLRAATVWLLALALLAGVLAQNIWASRQDLLRNAEQRLISDLAVGSRYVFERIASLKSKLETLDHQLPNGDTLFAKRQAHSLLKNLAGDDRSLLSMFIIEPNGMAYATFRTPEVEHMDLSDRSYFRAIVEGGGTGIYISEPHTGRLGHAEGRQFVAVSAPWHDDQGGLQGVLVGLLDYTSITELLTASVHDGSTRISVFTDDGRRVFGSAHHIVPSDQLASCTDAARGYEVERIDIADRQYLFACQELGPLGLSGAITRPIDAALMS